MSPWMDADEREEVEYRWYRTEAGQGELRWMSPSPIPSMLVASRQGSSFTANG